MKLMANEEESELGFIRASEYLLQKLMQGAFQPGQPLKESVLAKEVGVNRPSMREALCQAIGWGMVEYLPYRGYRVKDFTLKDLLDWSQLRETVEGMAARLLAGNCPPLVMQRLENCVAQEKVAYATGKDAEASEADIRFHLTLSSSCGNSRFAAPSTLCYSLACFHLDSSEVKHRYYLKITEERNRSTGKHHLSSAEQRQRERELTVMQHEAVVEAIREGDAALAEEVVRSHIRSQTQNLGLLIEILGDSSLTSAQIADERHVCRQIEKYFRGELPF